MDQIKEALIKAKAAPQWQPSREHREAPRTFTPKGSLSAEKPRKAWNIPAVQLDSRHLAEHRIVAHSMTDPGQVPFNQLRTRMLKGLKDNGWKRVAITSPSPGCGKTMVAVNLAISLARVPECRTVLIDLDLRKPSVARVLGVSSVASIGDYFAGAAELQDCFVQVAPNLSVGLTHGPIGQASEMMQGPRAAELFRELAASLNPDVLIFDLPPLMASDDAMGFMPNVDAALMVVAAGTSTAAEVDECERLVSGLGKYLGIVLNKADRRLDKYNYYY